MTQPFSYYKQTDYIVVALSIVPIIAQVLLSDVSAVALCVNWIAAGVFAWIIWDIIERHHLGLLDRNHALSISWTLMSLVLNFALINFNEYETNADVAQWMYVDKSEWKYLIQMSGFLVIIYSVMQTWQHRIDPIRLLSCGAIIGVVSTFLNYSLLWLLLFPVFFYYMRSWSKQNWGSLITGLVLAIWISYIVKLIVAGEDNADGFILSYATLIDNLMPERIEYTFWEWVFMGFTALLLIIYSISGYAINVAKTVKAHSSVIMLSTLSLIITALAIIDLSHLPNYLGLLSIFLSFQISIHQSCLIDAKNEWWTLFLLFLYIVLSIMPLFWSPF